MANLSDKIGTSGVLTDITGESIKNLSDVYSSMSPTDGQALIYDTTNGWQAETIESFMYDAVSGATHDLDVGSYNFFNAGTLTADTTVSFSNVPTEARWSYTFKSGRVVAELWDISTASHLRARSVSSQDTSPYGLFFKPDGSKMYVLGNNTDTVYEYTLSTSWDISTTSYSQSFSVGSQDTIPLGLFFKPDGTKMYVLGSTGDDVNEYTLSTAWDISTASYIQNFSVSSQETSPQSVFFKPDGTKMYVLGSTGDDVNEYTLSTAWDISTASYSQNFSVTAEDTGPAGLFFKPDGLKMYVIGNGNDAVYEYTLSTSWDISTASYSQNFSVTAEDRAPQSVFFKPDGSKMYVLGSVGDAVYEYDLGGLCSLTLPSSVENTPTAFSEGDIVTYDFFTSDGGTTVTIIDEEVL